MIAAGDWGQLIGLLVVLALSGISSLLQRRAEKAEQDRHPGPQPERRPEPTDTTEDWEAELRRLLRPPPSKGGAPPPLRPVPVEPAPPLVPRTAPTPSPKLAPAPAETEEGGIPHFQLPTLSESKTLLEQAGSLNEQVAARLHRVSEGLGHLDESAAALRDAAGLEQEVYQRIQQHIAVSGRSPVGRSGRGLSPQAVQLRQLLRSQQGVRQAVLASLVLSPPKGLEL